MRGNVDSYTTKAGKKLWRIRYELGPDPVTGKRRSTTRRGFEFKRDADAALLEALGKVEAGTHVDHSTTTVGEYLQSWLTGIRVKPTTRSMYETNVNVHLVPVKAPDGRTRPGIGGVKLQTLRPEHIDTLYRWLETEGKQRRGRDDQGRPKKGGTPLAAKSVRHVHTTLRKALHDAVERGYIVRNPADLAHPPSQRQSRSRKAVDEVWTPEQVRCFLAGAADDPLLSAYHLACTTGLRRGELLALRWDDVDLDRAQLRVCWTMTTVRGRLVEQDSAKTSAGERTIALDAGTVEVLRGHRQAQREARLLVGPAWEDTVGRLFVDPIGRPVRQETFLRRLHRHADTAGLPRIGVHGLRHSYATAALRAGVPVHVVSKRLGHADVGVTLNIYAHVLDTDDQAAADQAAAALLG